MRGGRWALLTIIILLLVDTVLGLSITGCPSPVDVDEVFSVTVSHSGAASVGVDVGGVIKDSESGSSSDLFLSLSPSNSYTLYGVYKMPGDTSWNYGSPYATCTVIVEQSTDSPGTVTLSGPSSANANEYFSLTASGSDADQIYSVSIYTSSGSPIQTHSCYEYGYPTSCSNGFSRMESSAGSYSYYAQMKDIENNIYTSNTVTVTVSDPCDGVTCPDTDPCKLEGCVGGSCTYTGNEPSTKTCDNTPPSHCDGAGSCLEDCSNVADTKCLSSNPGSTTTLSNWCSQSRTCFACAAHYHWEGETCVADQTCTDACHDGEVGCTLDGREKTCFYNTGTGCWAWTFGTSCGAGEACVPGTGCTETCTNECTAYSCANNLYKPCGTGFDDDSCYEYGPEENCDDGNVCTTDACASSGCSHANAAAGTTCDDGAASGSGQCSSGSCVDCVDDTGCSEPTPVCSNYQCVPAGTPVTYYRDADSDTYGDAFVSTTSSSGVPAGYVVDATDCDDANAAVHPGALEVCNAIDDDCDGLIDGNDPAMTACPAGESCQDGQCVASCIPSQEVCNGLDDDCDGLVDGDDSSMTSCDDSDACTVDVCGGFAGCLHQAVAPQCPPASTVTCNVQLASSNGCGDCRGAGTQCLAAALPYCARGVGCVACLENSDCAENEACISNTCTDCDDATTASTIACGTTAAVTRCDGSVASVVGSNCSGTNYVCQEGRCVTTSFVLVQDDVLVIADRGTAILQPTLTDLDGVPVSFPYTVAIAGWMSSIERQPTHADLGSHTVDLVASRLDTTQPLATTAVTVDVVCDPDNNLYGPCCRQDGTLLMDESSSCDLHNSEELGVCNSQGQCVENCVQDTYEACRDDRIYWFDSCNTRGSLVADCLANGQGCDGSGSQPVCVDEVQECTEPWVYACHGQEGVQERCGASQTILTCEENEDCRATASGVSCEANPCGDVDLLECGSRCVNPLTSRTDCGGCNNGCDSTELCDQGVCTTIPDCFVACDANADCAAGSVCINAGDCFESECQPYDVLENELDVYQLVGHDYLSINISISAETITFRLTNSAPVPLQEVGFTAAFAKAIAQDAGQLTVTGADTHVLVQDPMIHFEVPLVERERSFTVTAAHPLDPSYVNFVTITDINYTGLDATALLDSWNKTKNNLKIGLNKEFDGEKTTIHLTLDPSKSLFDLTMPVQIPKCMAEYASELELPENAQILIDDPLIAWQFDELNKPVDITFDVSKDIDQECLDQLSAMAFANRVGKPLSPWLALLIIPLLALTLIFFQRFGPRMEQAKLMPKKEYFRIGRDQGMSDEQIEHEWHDFKRRFR